MQALLEGRAASLPTAHLLSKQVCCGCLEDSRANSYSQGILLSQQAERADGLADKRFGYLPQAPSIMGLHSWLQGSAPLGCAGLPST